MEIVRTAAIPRQAADVVFMYRKWIRANESSKMPVRLERRYTFQRELDGPPTMDKTDL